MVNDDYYYLYMLYKIFHHICDEISKRVYFCNFVIMTKTLNTYIVMKIIHGY